MQSFGDGFLIRQPVPHDLLQVIRRLGEYKGKQDLYRSQAPRVLDSLRQAAVIESTESSNRIEGVSAPLKRIRRLVEEKTAPRNRSEREIAGYRDVLNTIHANHAYIPFTADVVRQLHRDLYRFAPAQGGRWKLTDNDITETLPDGTVRIRFKPVRAFQVAEAMAELHARFDDHWDRGAIDRLLLIPAYVLDFLCIHPFQDGNGRMARLITLLLLYRAGYEVGRHVSLEAIIERTGEGYYASLYDCSQGWHEGGHALLAFWEYFLGVMLLTAYREFEERIESLTVSRGAKREAVIDAIERLPNEFRYADVERACLGVSRPTISRALGDLRKSGKIECIRRGRDATWRKIERSGAATPN